MADRTVRAIFEAKVDAARKGISGLGKDVADAGKKIDDLTKDLRTLDSVKTDPEIDIEIDAAKKRLSDLTGELSDLKAMDASPEVELEIDRVKGQISDVRGEIKDLTAQKAEVRVDVAIKDAQSRISDLTQQLGELRTMEASPEVDVEIKEAQKKLRDAKTELRELSGAKAEMKVTADTSGVDSALSDMGDDAKQAGATAGDESGEALVGGLLTAIASIPIAGAVIGAGVAIAGGIITGIQQGLQIEPERDLFSARTGLDEATANRFGRAAGEAYAQAWGDSVADNLETARIAMEQGLIDADATDREIERVIAKLSGVTTIMQEDIPAAARAAGQMIKTGMVDNADEAFDVLIAGYQNGASASNDFLDTMEEYPTHFRDLGLSAAEATGLLIQGLDKGAFNADKVADALKELTIRVKEESPDTAEALGKIGLSAGEMADAFATGGDKAHDALGAILEGLAGVEDPADRSRIAVGLFGTQAEDMADALTALDLSTAADEIGGIEDAAGAADRALATMRDNTSAKVEEAKRNIEIAMDGIKGALAEAFSDDIAGAAEWVSRNRGPLMEFFLDLINAALDAGIGFAEFGASILDTIADISDAIAGMPKWLIGEEMKTEMGKVADSARSASSTLRTEVPGALNDVRDKVNDWAAPELLKAQIHDATQVMMDDVDAFSVKVDQAGGTVTINGDKMNAEEALDTVIKNINAEDGTVTINGNKVPAKDALMVLMGEIDRSKGDVKIGGNVSRARGDVSGLMGDIRGRSASVTVNASTGAAERQIDYLARPRSMTLSVRVAGANSVGGLLRHEGGWIKGLNAGGWVPGTDPGYDNVLWPLNSGGRTLQQPLTGGEFVVNSWQSAMWGPLLEWINSGGRPRSSSPTASSQSLSGLAISGTLDTPFGPAQVRGVVRSELSAAGRQARWQGGLA